MLLQHNLSNWTVLKNAGKTKQNTKMLHLYCRWPELSKFRVLSSECILEVQHFLSYLNCKGESAHVIYNIFFVFDSLFFKSRFPTNYWLAFANKLVSIWLFIEKIKLLVYTRFCPFSTQRCIIIRKTRSIKLIKITHTFAGICST